MKNTFYFLVLLTLIYSCSVKKPPVFKKIDNVKILSFKSDTIRLKADVFFENPNDVGGKISTDDLKIIVDNTEVAQVIAEEFKVPAKKEFSMPIFANIPAKNLFDSNKKGILGSLINSLLTNKINVRIKGKLEYVVFGFQKEFLVDKTEELKIKF